MRPEPADASELDAGLSRLTGLARTSLGHLTPEQCLRGERALLLGMARSKGRSRWVVPGLAALVVTLACTLAFVFRRVSDEHPLKYVVENGRFEPDQELVARDRVSPVVRFSDGTEIRLSPGTRARLRSVTSRGAALSVERGEVRADVIQASGSEWQFTAGPFVVRVTGTVFKLEFQPEEDRFDLRLERGSVTVVAPTANQPIPLRAGQWLTIRARGHEVFIRDLVAEAVDAAVQAAEPRGLGPGNGDDWAPHRNESTHRDGSAAPNATPALAADGPGGSNAPAGARAWASELARGKFDTIVGDALSRGLESSLEEASSEELSALADAARYTRRNDIARKALLATRRRFPGSRRATEAAFLLGRLAEAEKNEAGALEYFEAYLVEAPNGTYAPEALGRKLAVVQHTKGSSSARPIASDYVAKYPNGTYAPAARAILQNP